MTISTSTPVCPFVRPWFRLWFRPCVQKRTPFPAVVWQKVNNKSCLVCIKCKKTHPGSPSDPSGTAAAEAKPRYVYSILKPHGQSSRYQTRMLSLEVKPSFVKSILGQSFQKPCQTAAMWGEVELHICNFKKYHLPRVGPKQLCASAHLGCTRAAGTSY